MTAKSTGSELARAAHACRVHLLAAAVFSLGLNLLYLALPLYSLQIYDSGAVAVWTVDGTTLTGGGVVAGASPDWSVQGTGDFNGDQKSDILWQNDNGQAAVWYMDGTHLDGSALAGDPVPQQWVIS